MAFTQPCFIRKNTPELIKKLEKLGYFYTYYHHGSGIYCYHNIAQPFTYNNEIPKECIGVSQNNEELFLALTALRDDTDKNQWVIDEAKECFGCENSWSICDKDDMNDRIVYTHYRKATVEEIIEYFKNK